MQPLRQIAWLLDVDLSTSDVIRALRHRDRLVALVGEWADGGAVIAFDPTTRSTDVASVDDVPEVLPGPAAPTGTRFVGPGWFGVFGYQLGRQLEVLPPSPSGPGSAPATDLAYYPHVLRFDRATQMWWFEAAVSESYTADEVERLMVVRDGILTDLDRAGATEPLAYTLGDFDVTPGLDQHRCVLSRIISHVHAGDIFQANLCLQLGSTVTGDPLDLFLAGVDELAPAYAAFVRTDSGAVASLSPELFLHRQDRRVRTAPIKGTAPRWTDPEELRLSRKNRAENVMIVDLMRNDLGRVCVPGSVVVPESLSVQPHAGVWHLVSEVMGDLLEEVTDAELLRRTFPPGSVTGAPKVRAMELINTYESSARRAYTGAIGRASRTVLELNVAIRTFEFEDARVWLGVGGGIVANSVVEDEVAECFVKATPLLAAIGGRLDRAVLADLAAIRPDGPAESSRERIGAGGPGRVDELRTPVRADHVGVAARTPCPDVPSGRPGSPSVLVIDNYDSFVFNLAQYCAERGAEVEVVRNDRVSVDQVLDAVRGGMYDRVLLSPGPGAPSEAGICVDLVRRAPASLRLFGVCLGHQAIVEAYGGTVLRAPEPVHGQDAVVVHDGRGVFAGIGEPLDVGRYHSLVADRSSLRGTPLVVSAETHTGLVMGVRHHGRPVEGVQFHPESILTPRGGELIANFLRPGPVPTSPLLGADAVRRG